MHQRYGGGGRALSEGHPVQRALLFQVIDLLVLYILHSTNANQSRRGVERVLKAKVRTGMIQEALLQRTFRDYAQVCLPDCDSSSRLVLVLKCTRADFYCVFNQT